MRLLALHGTSSGVSAPVVIAVVAVLAGAWLYHTIRDHHGHLWLLRTVRPGTVIPPTRHDSKWHSLSHPQQLVVNLMLGGAAVIIGLAWELSPAVCAIIIILAAITWIAVAVTRAANARSAVHRSADREKTGGKT